MKKRDIYKIVSISLLILPLLVFATTDPRITKVVLKIAYYLGMAAIGIGAVLVAMGIYKIATSAGDPRGLSEGTSNIVWGIIAVILGLFLQANWLRDFIGNI